MRTVSVTVISTTALLSAVLAAMGQEFCGTTTFSPPAYSPVALLDLAGERAEGRALTSGRFAKHMQQSCNCDVAIATTLPLNPTNDALVLMSGNDDGTFLRAAVVKTDKHPAAATAGAFTVPNSADLDEIAVVTNPPSGAAKASLYLPLETGGRIEYQRSAAGPWDVPRNVKPAGIVSGRFNRDEHLDLAVVGDTQITILFGNASGGFTSQTIDLPSGTGRALASGRFSGAGDTTDLAIGVDLADGADKQSAVIIAHWSDEASAMKLGSPIPVGGRGSSGTLVKALDLSRPGVLQDLAVAYTKAGGAVENGALRILASAPNGLAPPSAEVPVQGTPISLATANIDKGNIADLVVSTHGDSASADNGTVQIFQGVREASGVVGLKPWVKSGAARSRAIAAIKLPAQGGDQDTARTVIPAVNDDTVSFIVGGGDGVFNEPPVVVTQLSTDISLLLAGPVLARDPGAAADQSSPPLVDLVGARRRDENRQTLSTWLATGAGSFAEPLDHGAPLPPRLIGATPNLMALGRLNADDISDLVVIDTKPTQTAGATMRTFKGTGAGGFDALGNVSEILLPLQEKPVAVAIAPFMGQGDAKPADIAVLTDSGKLTIWVNQGDGRFQSGPVTNLGFQPRRMVLSKMLRSSHSNDLVVSDEQLRVKTGADQREMVDLRRFTTWFNNGAGQFRLGGSFETENSVDHLVVADVNFDGMDDIITVGDRHTKGGFVSGTFLPETTEPNRVQVYANDGLEGFVENVTTGSPFDTDSCKGTTIKNVFPLLFGPRSLVLGGFASEQLRDPGGFLLFATPSLTFSAVATGDGGFKPASCTNPSLPKELPSIQGEVSKTSISRPATLSPPLSAFETGFAVSGRFRNRLQGTQFPETAATGRLTTVEMQEGFCPGQSFVPPKPASTCQKLDNFCVPGDCPHNTIEFPSSELKCPSSTTASCHGKITRDGVCEGFDNCFCAPTSPGPMACQTTRKYGPLVFTFASCM